MRILVAEHDSALAQSLELMLKSESFNVYATNDGADAVDCGKLFDYDCILLGDTPDATACDMLKSLRMAKVKSSIIVLSRSRSIENIVQALGIGADDFMTLPFHQDELAARIHAVVRRSKGHAQSVIETGPLSVNLTTKTVKVNGESVHLTGKEYGMLELLSLRKGSTLTKEMFLNHLYGGRDEPEIKIIDVFICKLRRKIDVAMQGGAHELLQTVWGRGYLLADPKVDLAPSPSMASEVRQITDDPPTGFVSNITINKAKQMGRDVWKKQRAAMAGRV